MARRLLFVIILAVVAMGGTAQAAEKEITVSAAISLKNAFEEIGQLFESEHRGMKVSFNFGASGDLARQIAGGAPVDVFSSAAVKDMDEIEKRGLVVPGSRIDFAGNSVVLIAPAGSGTALKSFAGLASPGIGKIAVGNPATVPAGRYAAGVLEYYKLSGVLKDRLVFTGNVRQALDYVSRNEVDAGIVYATDAAVRKKEVTVVASAPDASHKPIVYPIAVVSGTRAPAASNAFIAVVTSGKGLAILRKYGFRSAAGK
jgi:molybdate transport system substrate-binding protein